MFASEPSLTQTVRIWAAVPLAEHPTLVILLAAGCACSPSGRPVPLRVSV